MMLACTLIALAVGAMAMAWMAHRRRTRRLDRWGLDYNVQRMPGESNRDYQLRIRNRSVIRGFPRW